MCLHKCVVHKRLEHSAFWVCRHFSSPLFLSLSTEVTGKCLDFQTGTFMIGVTINGYIPVIPEGRPGAERFPAHCCRLKGFRYISDNQPHLGVNHPCLELLSLMCSWKDCPPSSAVEMYTQHRPNKPEVTHLLRDCFTSLLFVCLKCINHTRCCYTYQLFSCTSIAPQALNQSAVEAESFILVGAIMLHCFPAPYIFILSLLSC